MEKLAGTNETAQNKLVLLYFIKNINLPISRIQLTQIITENRFMNYFILHQFISELIEEKMLQRVLVNKKSFYTITKKGLSTLEFLKGIIPVGIKKQLDEIILKHKKDIKTEISIKSDYEPVTNNEYIVSLYAGEESFTLVDIKITVGTKSDARLLCENWENHSHNIYPEIIESLLKER